MAVNVGSASVTITPTMTGFGSKINKELGSAGTSGGAAFSKAFSGKATSSTGSMCRGTEAPAPPQARGWARPSARP